MPQSICYWAKQQELWQADIDGPNRDTEISGETLVKWTWGIIVVTLIGALTCVTYVRRFQLQAIVWHWRHGNSAQFRGYEIQIPPDWFVRESSPLGIDLIEARSSGRFRSPLGTNSVRIFLNPGPEKIDDLDVWRSSRRRQLASEGLQNVEERTIEYNEETAVCVGGDLFKVMRIPLAGFSSVDCQSSGGLHLLFNGYSSDLSSFYAIVAGMRHSTSRARK